MYGINRNSKWGALVRSENPEKPRKTQFFGTKKDPFTKKTHKKDIFLEPKNSVFLKTRNFGTRQSAYFDFFLATPMLNSMLS